MDLSSTNAWITRKDYVWVWDFWVGVQESNEYLQLQVVGQVKYCCPKHKLAVPNSTEILSLLQVGIK